VDIATTMRWIAERYPRRTAVGGALPVTYAEWDARTDMLARALLSTGTNPGDHVVLMLQGGEPLVSVHLAAQKASLTSVPLSTRFGIAASEFFTAGMTTTVQPEEVIASVHFPYATTSQGFAFAEIARRHGDFALAGVAVRVDVVDPLHPAARVVCFGVSEKPVVRDVSAWLASAAAPDGAETPEATLCASLSGGSVDFAVDAVDTVGDAHGSTAYRRQLISALAKGELARAYTQATQNQLGAA